MCSTHLWCSKIFDWHVCTLTFCTKQKICHSNSFKIYCLDLNLNKHTMIMSQSWESWPLRRYCVEIVWRDILHQHFQSSRTHTKSPLKMDVRIRGVTGSSGGTLLIPWGAGISPVHYSLSPPHPLLIQITERQEGLFNYGRCVRDAISFKA